MESGLKGWVERVGSVDRMWWECVCRIVHVSRKKTKMCHNEKECCHDRVRYVLRCYLRRVRKNGATMKSLKLTEISS